MAGRGMTLTESAGGVVVRDGMVAVVSQSRILSQEDPSWSLPKGHKKPGETAEQTARREIREETGITDLELVRDLGTYERYRGEREDSGELKRIHMFLFRTEQEELEPQDPNNPEAVWVPKEEVVEKLTYEKDREFFRSIRDL